MRKRRVLSLLLAAALTAALPAGCGLLPEEAAAPTPPVIRSYEKVEYTFATVERGDVVELTKVSFKYAPALQQSLSFPISGAAVASVYVTTGETVEQGALLAELEDGGLVDRIDAQNEQISNLTSSISSLRRDLELERRAWDVKIAADPNNASLKTQKQAASERYTADIDAANLRLSAAKARLGELEDELAQRKMYAPFDGTVTFIRSFGSDGYRSTAGENFITVSDKSTMTFSAEGSAAVALFKLGDRVTMSTGGDEYPAEIIEMTDQTVTLEPLEHISGVGEGSYGNVWVVTGAAYDVLRVPSSAVTSANGQPIVYTLVDGVRTLREVEVGFAADGYTEIISGLSEGEQVIAK